MIETATTARAQGPVSPVELLNERLRQLPDSDWRHRFEIGTDGRVVTPDSYGYRRKVLEAVFASLLRDRSVLVLDEVSGLHSTLLAQAAARKVSASSGDPDRCAFISEVTRALGVATDVVNSEMLAFENGEPYVDLELNERHDFLLALGKTWPLFNASAGSFDAIVEACTSFVTDGLVLDWDSAAWASPPPPGTYNIAAFARALGQKFEFVTCYGDWLIVAVGKLPRDGDAVAEPPPQDPSYRDLVARFRDGVASVVPAHVIVLVTSEGDPELLDLGARTGWHFPQGEAGEYAGHHPRDADAAIAELESLRRRGAEFLAIPQASFWWLDHYGGFHEHLAKTARVVLHDDETCVVFALESAPAASDEVESDNVEIELKPRAARVAHLRAKPWNAPDFSVPDEIFNVPGMLSTQEKRMLYHLASSEYTGEGVIADMGSFLGGSTICFAAGLRARGVTGIKIHAYDVFKVSGDRAWEFFPDGAPPDLRTRSLFDANVADYRDLITVHDGDVLDFTPEGASIEFLFVDIAKSYRVFDHILLNYFPSLMPAKSIIIMQDYLWGATGPWHHVAMERLRDYWEYVVDTDVNSVVFLLRDEIPRDELHQACWMNLGREEKLELMDQAIQRLDTEPKRAFLRQNREMILDGRDRTWGMQYHDL